MPLSKNQNNLLVMLSYEIANSSKPLHVLKDLSVSHWGIKSFDGTFNALLHKGYIQHYTDHNDNSFLMTIKGQKKAKTLNLI